MIQTVDLYTTNEIKQMDSNQIAQQIIALKEADLALRDKLIQEGLLGNGYNKEMEELHVKNAHTLDEIINSIGYPTIDKVGKGASEAAWLIIQHAISLPAFMKKCLKLLEEAVSEGKANPIQLAYMSDRISVYEGRPQLYGTSYDWDEKGELNPQPFDDVTKVNLRRKLLGLNSKEEQTKVMRKRAESEGEAVPSDYKERMKAYDAWRKQVGWI